MKLNAGTQGDGGSKTGTPLCRSKGIGVGSYYGTSIFRACHTASPTKIFPKISSTHESIPLNPINV